MRLSDLKKGESAIIVRVYGRSAFKRRITEMGFLKGEEVTVIKSAPLKDPVEYTVMGYDVSLRLHEASLIEVVTKEEAQDILETKQYNGVFNIDEVIKETVAEKSHSIHVALVGNPNVGKTSLFNQATNSQEHVGNYSGVTVDSKTAIFSHNGYKIYFTDLPGTYSLSTFSPEELYVREYLLKNMPDVVVNIVDASNLERNLYLTTQLIDMDVKVVVALNMYDELERNGQSFDYVSMGNLLGIPFVPTISSKGVGKDLLLDTVIHVYNDEVPTFCMGCKQLNTNPDEGRSHRKGHHAGPCVRAAGGCIPGLIHRHIHINYGEELEYSIKTIQRALVVNKKLIDTVSSRFLAIKCLEKDAEVQKMLFSECENYEQIDHTVQEEVSRIERLMGEDSSTLIYDAKYGFIDGALKETFFDQKSDKVRLSTAIDTILTHPILGFPLFFVILFLMFQGTFLIGSYPVTWIESFVEAVGNLMAHWIPDGWLRSLIVDGVISGVGGVLVFLPNILILFMFISIMEDSGYMTRVVFIMDRLMHRIGLHGRSFIPLIVGFGCNVPAIMAARAIEGRRNRLITILITPFMSCSARLPVYVLFASVFFPKCPGSVTFLIYVIGIVLAIITALLLQRFFPPKTEQPYVMEHPPYRIPTLKSVLKHIWEKAKMYLQKMATVILLASIAIWVLKFFPRPDQTSSDASLSSVETVTAAPLRNSYIDQIGKCIAPVFKPLGFDYPMGVGLLTGVAAKEIVVSTLSVMYTGEDTDDYAYLTQRLQTNVKEVGPDGNLRPLTGLTAFCFMLFILLYVPCIPTVIAIGHETGSFKWAFFSVAYNTLLAWIICFLVQTVGRLWM